MSLCCVICHDEFGDKQISAVQCGHTFHFICLNEWRSRSKSCPTCRFTCENFDQKIIPSLFFDKTDDDIDVSDDFEWDLIMEVERDLLNSELADAKKKLVEAKKKLLEKQIQFNRVRFNELKLSTELSKLQKEFKAKDHELFDYIEKLNSMKSENLYLKRNCLDIQKKLDDYESVEKKLKMTEANKKLLKQQRKEKWKKEIFSLLFEKIGNSSIIEPGLVLAEETSSKNNEKICGETGRKRRAEKTCCCVGCSNEENLPGVSARKHSATSVASKKVKIRLVSDKN